MILSFTESLFSHKLSWGHMETDLQQEVIAHDSASGHDTAALGCSPPPRNSLCPRHFGRLISCIASLTRRSNVKASILPSQPTKNSSRSVPLTQKTFIHTTHCIKNRKGSLLSFLPAGVPRTLRW